MGEESSHTKVDEQTASHIGVPECPSDKVAASCLFCHWQVNKCHKILQKVDGLDGLDGPDAIFTAN
jgi:hypothetical protein